MISVIISTFDRLDRLKKAIQSVKNQTFTDWELIIADDHSTDGTQAYIASLNDPKIIYTRLTRNSGTDTKPKNAGIKLAKGEFIAFLDDDCEYRPDHLNALYKCLQNYPDVSVAYGDRWIIDETKEIVDQIGYASDFNPFSLMRRNYIDTSDALIRKQALKYVGGFDERYKKYVDWNLWVRMAKCGYIFKRVPLLLTDYHLHKDMKSQKKLDEKGFSEPAWDAFDVEIQLPYLGEVKEPKVAIYSITYNRLEYTKTCFESLERTAGYPYDHFIVDNGSTDGTYEWLNDSWHSKALISNGVNKGISKASNIAIEEIYKTGTYDIIIKIDNDCYFKSNGWLEKMVEIWKSNRRMALSCYIEGLKDNPGGAQRIDFGKIKGEFLGLTRHIGGICHFVDASAYKDFRWNENDFLHGMQDLEFSQYLLSKGYQMAYLENYFAQHYEGTEGQHARFPEYFEKRKHEKTTRYQP